MTKRILTRYHLPTVAMGVLANLKNNGFDDSDKSLSLFSSESCKSCLEYIVLMEILVLPITDAQKYYSLPNESFINATTGLA